LDMSAVQAFGGEGPRQRDRQLLVDQQPHAALSRAWSAWMAAYFSAARMSSVCNGG
jgi:hypothetical protein